MKHPWHIPLMVLLVLLSGCRKAEPVPAPQEKVVVHLTLSVPRSKAESAGKEAPVAPQGNEAYIAPHDVEVLVYALDGTYQDRAVMTQVSPTAQVDRYRLSGTLSALHAQDVEEQAYKIVVLANLRGIQQVAFPQDYDQFPHAHLYTQTLFNYTAGRDLTQALLQGTRGQGGGEEGGRIPMWGMLTARLEKDVTLHIQMLRALAKVEVSLDATEVPDKVIRKISLVNGRSQGNLAPSGAAAAAQTWFSHAHQGTDPGLLNLPASAPRGPKVEFVQEADGHHYLYLPEQEPMDEAWEAAWMEVDIAEKGAAYDAPTDRYRLYFAQESGKRDRVLATAFPVVRNHWYAFKITGFPHATLEYQVCAWNQREGEIAFH